MQLDLANFVQRQAALSHVSLSRIGELGGSSASEPATWVAFVVHPSVSSLESLTCHSTFGALSTSSTSCVERQICHAICECLCGLRTPATRGNKETGETIGPG